MKQNFSIIKAGFSIFTLICIWITWVYPNDKRIPQPQTKATSNKEQKLTKTGSVFQNQIPIVFSPAQQRPQRFHSDTITPAAQSTRYQHPHQTLVSIGHYPEHIESHDSFILPAQHTATWTIPHSTDIQKLKVASFEDTSITITQNTSTTHKIQASPTPPTAWLYKHILRYTQPNTTYANWHNITTDLDRHRSISVRCNSQQAPCFISNPEFFKTSTQQQNTILILVDTLRHDAISKEKTPNIHHFFAKQSTRYTHCLSSSNMTSPSVNALLSCQHPEDIKDIAFSYGSSTKAQNSFYSHNQPSFPKILQNHLIHTAMIGNISIISDSIGIGVHHGFDDLITLERDGYDTARITQSATKWLHQHHNQNFFLYLHFHAPHGPYKAPIHNILRSFRGRQDLNSSASILKWLYRAEVQHTDQYLGIIFNTLEERNLLNNTRIILTADHGDHHTDHPFIGNAAGEHFTGASFDHGATLLNDEIQVPLMIRDPQETHTQNLDHWTSNIAIGPHILQRHNIPVPSYCHDKNINIEKPLISFAGFKQKGILLNGRYKYIRSFEADKRSFSTSTPKMKTHDVLIPEQAYDILKDQQETHNIHEAALLAKLRNAFSQAFQNPTAFTLTYPNRASAILKITTNEPPINPPTDIEIQHHNNLYTLTTDRNISLTFNKKPQISIKQNDLNIPVLHTSSQLPITHPPLEINPLQPQRKQKGATLIQHEKKRFQTVEITAMNLKIERMLKQWGYLSESS